MFTLRGFSAADAALRGSSKAQPSPFSNNSSAAAVTRKVTEATPVSRNSAWCDALPSMAYMSGPDQTPTRGLGNLVGPTLGVPQMMSACCFGSIISVTPPTS